MGEQEYYIMLEKLAEQERQRQRNIAQSYWNAGPSIGNLYNAAVAFANSLPIIGVSAEDMNPYLQTGIAPSPGRISPKSFKTLTVADKYKNYIANPAERAAAQDYVRDLKQSGRYNQFLKDNPGYKIDTEVEPGISEDWQYPYDVMVKHGLRKPVVTTNTYTKPQVRQITPKKTTQQKSREYYREKVEDRNQGVYKRQRKAFNMQKMLEDGDARHVVSGRPSMAKVRLADQNIQNYSRSAQKQYDKLRLKAAKRGVATEDMVNVPDIKDFLRNLIESEGHRW